MPAVPMRHAPPARRRSLSLTLAFAACVPLSLPLAAQTAGPVLIVRDGSISGGTYERAAAFEPSAGFIVWLDTRNETTTDADIYAQKVNANGTAAWTPDGVPVCLFAQQQWEPTIAPDGAGGAVVAWRDQRAIGARYIYAQRLSSTGQALWATDGVRVGDTKSGEQYLPAVHLEPDGTFLLGYGTTRSGFPSTYWIIAKKLDAAGQRLWGTDGIDALNAVRNARSVRDGSGGLIVVGRKRDQPDGFRFQRVLANQSLAWPSVPEAAAALPSTALFDVAADGAGGVILAYIEGSAVRAVRVAANGLLPWSATAMVLAPTNVVTSQRPVVEADGTGGAFVAWLRNTPRDVCVQHLTADGAHLWPAGGAVVPDLSGTERDAAMVADGAGGIFISFQTSSSLRAQRLDQSGVGQWKVGGSNGLSLMTGFEPWIGLGAGGPMVIYSSGTGISARVIDVPVPTTFRLTDVGVPAAGQLRLTLTGGTAGTAYDVLRATALGATWTPVGTTMPGVPWVDTNAPASGAFYQARRP